MADDDLTFFDAHCHLQDPRVAHCVDQLVAEAVAGGVQRLACNGCCPDDWPRVAELARRHPQLIPNFGLHPWWVAGRSADWLDRLTHALEACPHAGLGECGLDRSQRCAAGIEEQEEVLCAQLALGRLLHRPISVHCVRAYGRLADAVRGGGPFPAGLVLHSWGGSAEMVPLLAGVEGVHFSLSGHLLQLPPAKARASVQQIPLDRLLLETDAPDARPRVADPRLAARLAPVPPSPGNRQAAEDGSSGGAEQLNHPVNIRVMLDVVADMMGKSRHEVANAARQNAERIFCCTGQI